MPYCESFLLRSADSKACVCPGEFIFLKKEVANSSDLEYAYQLTGERVHEAFQFETGNATVLACYFSLFRMLPHTLGELYRNPGPYKLTKTNLWIPNKLPSNIDPEMFLGRFTDLLEALEFWFEQRRLVDECYELVHLLYCMDESAQDLYSIAEQVRDCVTIHLPISTLDYVRERGVRLIDDLKKSQTHKEALDLLPKLANYASGDSSKMKAVLFSLCQIPSVPNFMNLTSEKVYEIVKKEPSVYSPNERLRKILRGESIPIADTFMIPPIFNKDNSLETCPNVMNLWFKGANYKYGQVKPTLPAQLIGFRTSYGDLYVLGYIPADLIELLVDLPSFISLSDVTHALAFIKLLHIMNMYETFRLLTSSSIDNELLECLREVGWTAYRRVAKTNEEEPDVLLNHLLIETAGLAMCFARNELQRLSKAMVTAPIYDPNINLEESAVLMILKEAEDDFDYFTQKHGKIAQWTLEQMRADLLGFRRRHFHRLVHLLTKNQNSIEIKGKGKAASG